MTVVERGPDVAVAADPVDPTPDGHRPQTLLLSFLGALVLDRETAPLPASVLLQVLGGLGVAEAAARATLTRMSRRGLLQREQVGRTARYATTPQARALLRRGRVRVESAQPFHHPDDEWTLLSYSVPESRRDLRHQVRSRLAWAGFGGLRDGLWIAPGTVDVAAVLTEGGLGDATGLADWFAARPMPGTDVDGFVRRAWDVDAVRGEHERFIATWDRVPGPHSEVQQLTLLGADWLRLLRSDPGLPAAHLGPGWPAARSTAVYRAAFDALEPGARAALASLSATALRRG